MNDIYLEKAKANGLLDVIKDWIKTEKYVSVSKIQREFSVGFNTSASIFEELKREGLIESTPTYSKGNRVFNSVSYLKIYLLDKNETIVDAWKKAFKEDKGITIVQDDFAHFMNSNKVQCVVSPANSYGVMTGGFDLAITNYFGDNLQREVQRYIKDNLYGEQPVGTSIAITIPNTDQILIHTPTMQTPKKIKDDFVIYQCMRATLIKALEMKIESIVIPAFGGACGKVTPKIIAKRMKEAFDQVFQNHKEERKLVTNSQYTLAVESLEEVDRLVKLLQERGYKAKQGLDNALLLKEKPIGICVDNVNKTIFQLNTSCMACFCTFNKTRPLSIRDVIDNIDKLIDNPDIVFYNKILRSKMEDE